MHATSTFITEVLYPVTNIQLLKIFCSGMNDLCSFTLVFLDNDILYYYKPTSININKSVCIELAFKHKTYNTIIKSTWVQAHTHTHTRILTLWTKAISRNQARAGLWPAHAWFNNKTLI